MGTFSKLKAELADLLKGRGVRRVVYFHCDHWEPWKFVPGHGGICEKNAEDVAHFVATMERLDYARRLTLFYKPVINFEIAADRPASIKAHPDDGVVFRAKSERNEAITRSAIRPIAEHTGHEFQLHVHHENFTFNTGHTSEPAMSYFASELSRTYEELRLDLAVKVALRMLEEETGRKLDRWFFVHGQWALNASDPSVCHIVREIEILMDNGCLGDFTMPAGRVAVNPRLDLPYLCKPVAAPRGYDLQECEPEIAYGNGAAAGSKFFIWSSEIKHAGCSLDYYAPWVRKRLEEVDDLAREMVSKSYCIDGTLFIKTHAHSLHPNYFEDTRLPIFPHAHPRVQNLLSVIVEAAATAGSEVAFRTASEVYDEFTRASYAHPNGTHLTIPGESREVAGVVPPPTAARDACCGQAGPQARARSRA